MQYSDSTESCSSSTMNYSDTKYNQNRTRFYYQNKVSCSDSSLNDSSSCCSDCESFQTTKPVTTGNNYSTMDSVFDKYSTGSVEDTTCSYNDVDDDLVTSIDNVQQNETVKNFVPTKQDNITDRPVRKYGKYALYYILGSIGIAYVAYMSAIHLK